MAKETAVVGFIAFAVLVLSFREVLAVRQSYVVYLGGHHEEDLEHEVVVDSHCELLASVLGSKEAAKDSIFYSYTKSVNGFAAHLEEEHALAVSKLSGVLSVFLNRERKLHTTRSWGFLGLEGEDPEAEEIPEFSLWTKARFGKDVIVANLDTGVWPEAASFHDAGFGPIPSRWRGSCQNGTNFTAAYCNRKLIGARYFIKGYEAKHGPLDVNKTGEFLSPRDKQGHGTHTLSTAGGNFVKNASIYGYAEGIAKGGAPHARVAAYKVCWEDSCYDADILAAFDAGVNDGVDVFSVSLGGSILSEANLDDAISIGSFHAVQRGKVVVASAGNSGPFAATVSNIAPWIINVGASSIDRTFLGTASLGNNKIFTGQSLSDSSLPDRKKYPLVYASNVRGKNASENDGKLCKLGSLDPQKVKGKIVACLRGDNARVEKGEAVRSAGGAGMILLNTQSDGGELLADPHVLPAVHLTAADGEAVLVYINSTKSPIASISAPNTLLNSKPAPVMTAFSSVGPNLIFPDIIKPDITAPGLNILAAWTGASSPTGLDFDHRIVPYNVISGTSMSCPHVAGVSALLKAAFPHWTPAAIRSAIMTSATRIDNSKALIKDSTDQAASPFNFGAGHVRPNGAGNPGLIYDTTVDDYLVFLCSFGYTQKQIIAISGKPFACPKQKQAFYNLNYPSIAVSKINTTIGAVSVKRTVTYVAEGSAVFTSTVKSPRGVIAAVWPTKLQFSKTGEKKSFTVVLKARKDFEKMVNVSSYGYLIWTHGADHVVRSPIVVCKAGTNCLTSS